LDLIDARVNAGRERTTAVGTLAERTSATRALVLFDGSSVAAPVKMFSAALAEEGDRVGLVKFGSDWVIVGAFAAVELGTWIDYSGSLVVKGATGAATKGTSTYMAEYMWINRSLMRVRIRVDFLTGFVQGTGVALFSVPFAISANALISEVGAWWLNDSGVATRSGGVYPYDADFVALYADSSGSGVIFGGTPFSVGDNLAITHEYEPA
jgi:hypothetical protein